MRRLGRLAGRKAETGESGESQPMAVAHHSLQPSPRENLADEAKMTDDWLEIGREFIEWLKQKTGYLTISSEYILSLWAKYGQEFLNDRDNQR